VEKLTSELERQGRGRIVGRSRGWRQALRLAARVAGAETTVLVTGETGTGKEVLARMIHLGSPRARGPFAALNCAALPEALVESELFGHERGAFTGAAASRAGIVERAAGGTLFLDEVAELPPSAQAKLLRLLEQRELQRLGGARTLKADVRIVAATHRDLRAAVARGEFRADLFYRLDVFGIHLPPLRARRDDVLPLTESFLVQFAHRQGRAAPPLTPAAAERLLEHRWPGNVRELRNAVERAVLLCDGGPVAPEHLPEALAAGRAPAA
jgi:transcriptional regulator with PAS, ATPase and Fis domain